MIFIIDEDLPRSLAKVLLEKGYQVLDVRDIGLKGSSDRSILDYAINRCAAVITADIGFAGIAYLQTQTHFGLILLRIPNAIKVNQMNDILVNALEVLHEEDLTNNIVVVELNKIRIRKKE
jgi:predicted nuclease of predicted toxin-antitoxin system